MIPVSLQWSLSASTMSEKLTLDFRSRGQISRPGTGNDDEGPCCLNGDIHASRGSRREAAREAAGRIRR